MLKFLNNLFQKFGDGIVVLATNIVQFGIKLINYKEQKRQDEQKEKQKKEQDAFLKRLDEMSKKGSVDDLLNFRR